MGCGPLDTDGLPDIVDNEAVRQGLDSLNGHVDRLVTNLLAQGNLRVVRAG